MTGAKDVVFPLCGVACWVAFAYKLLPLLGPRRRRPPRRQDPALFSVLAVFAFKGAAFVLATPGIAAATDRGLGVPNLAALGIHVLGGVGFSAAVLTTLTFWAHPPHRAWPTVRGLVAVAGATALLLIVLWAAAGVRTRSAHYLAENSQHLLVSLYLLCYVGVLLLGLVAIARLCWRQSTQAERRWTRRGLRVTGSGAVIYMGSFLNRLSAVVVAPFGIDPLQWELVVPVCTGTGMLLIVTGLTMPGWGPRASALRGWLASYRAHAQLRPLWTALYRAMPEIALHAPSRSMRALHYRLYRRVIEIRDARLQLRAYMDSDVAAEATRDGHRKGLVGQELEAHVEACQFKAALRRKVADAPGDEHSGCEDPQPGGGDDISSELAWLRRVARAYARAPVIASESRGETRGETREPTSRRPDPEIRPDDAHEHPGGGHVRSG